MPYMIIHECKRVAYQSGEIATSDGEKVIVTDGEWGACSSKVDSTFDRKFKNALKFDTADNAHKFMEKYTGNPWYYKCNGNYEVVEVKPIYKQVIDGYEVVK